MQTKNKLVICFFDNVWYLIVFTHLVFKKSICIAHIDTLYRKAENMYHDAVLAMKNLYHSRNKA
jgi:hypothetical protein